MDTLKEETGSGVLLRIKTQGTMTLFSLSVLLPNSFTGEKRLWIKECKSNTPTLLFA